MRKSKHAGERKRVMPDTHLIYMFQQKPLPTADAVAEAFDNSLDAGASIIAMTIGADKSVTFADNGKGLKDLDKLIGIAHSKSRSDPDAIGQFGIGAKDAQMHFGERADFQSVHNGYYYKHSIDWEYVKKTRLWPFEFDGTCRLAAAAPESIRQGGTIIKITRPVARPRVNMELLTKKLSHRYLLALRNNKKISIHVEGSNPKTYDLDAKLATEGVNPGEVVSGWACDLPFKVMFTSLKPDHDPALPGVHFGFSNRFIMRAQRLGDRGLPPTLYAEVLLSPAWKGCLSPNKTDIVRHYEELSSAVLEIMQGLIAKLEKQAEQVQIEHVNLALTRDFANVIVFDSSKKGEKSKGSQVIVSNGGKTPKPVQPNPHVAAHLAEVGGLHGFEKKKKRPSGISFERNDGLGKHITSKYSLENGTLKIYLNGSVPVIEMAYQPPYKPIALWPVIAREVSKFCRDSAAELDTILPGFVDALNAIGWEISLDDPDELSEKVFTYVMKQVPLSKAERAKLSKLKVVDGGS